MLLLNVSGTIQPDELPSHLSNLPRITVTPADITPGVDVISSVAALNDFTRCLRTVLSELEATDKQMKRLHVLAAVPLSAAVALGRARDAHVHPTFLIYDRTPDGYQAALEIS